MTATTDDANLRPYLCMYKAKKVTVYAQTTFAAQTKAVPLLKPRKQYEITVMPLNRDIDPAELP